MPQARRKTPFSGKAKKEQLKSKKQSKVMLMPNSSTSNTYEDMVSLNYQPSKGRTGRDTNRYALKFYRETNEELMRKKEEALKEVKRVRGKDLEINPDALFPPDVTFPQRPPWDFKMTPAQLDAQEQRYFKNYVDSLQASEHWKDMSYFELNLETWRQLWRVMEMSDILLVIVDVRYAGCMFPPALSGNKSIILVLNKIDLVPASIVLAWKEYFTKKYPGIKIVYFTSCPGYNLRGTTEDKGGLQVRRRKGRLRMCIEGATQILEACKDIVQNEVDLRPWEHKIKEEMNMEDDDDVEIAETVIEAPDTSYYAHEKYKNGILTIGCIGHPNVGKSSLMNAVLGKKRLSVSKTPGHTKHFQTIYITPQVRFCDCPGLVFPSKVPREVQILMGSYPIAQLREPYTAIRYLAERVDLPQVLRIDHPENDDTWSPRDICDGWAKKRGYYTAKAARLDSYRAANSLLRMALDGTICMWLTPPGFTENSGKFEESPEISYIKQVQALSKGDEQIDEQTDVLSSEGESETDDSASETTDEEENVAMANKFAALANED